MKKYWRKKILWNVNVGAKHIADLKSQERLTGYHQYISNLFMFEANVKSQKISETDKNNWEQYSPTHRVLTSFLGKDSIGHQMPKSSVEVRVSDPRAVLRLASGCLPAPAGSR